MATRGIVPPPFTEADAADIIEALMKEWGMGANGNQTVTTNIKVTGDKKMSQLAEDTERVKNNMEAISEIKIGNRLTGIRIDEKKTSADLVKQLRSVFNTVEKNFDRVFDFPEKSKTLQSLNITHSLPDINKKTEADIDKLINKHYSDENSRRKKDIKQQVTYILQLQKLVSGSEEKTTKLPRNISNVEQVTSYVDNLKNIIRASGALDEVVEKAKIYMNLDTMGIPEEELDKIRQKGKDAEDKFYEFRRMIDRTWYNDLDTLISREKPVTDKDIQKILDSPKAFYKNQEDKLRESRELKKQTTTFSKTEQQLSKYVLPQKEAYEKLDKIAKTKKFKEYDHNISRDFSGYLASYLAHDGDLSKVLLLLNMNSYFDKKYSGETEELGLKAIKEYFGLDSELADYFSDRHKNTLKNLINQSVTATKALADMQQEISELGLKSNETDFLDSITAQFENITDKANSLRRALDLLKLHKSDDVDKIVEEFSQRDWTTNQTLKYLSGNSNVKINSKKDRQNAILGILTEDQKKNLTPEPEPPVEEKPKLPTNKPQPPADRNFEFDTEKQLQRLVETEEEAIEKSQQLAQVLAEAFGTKSNKSINEAADVIQDILLGNSDNYNGVLDVFKRDATLVNKYATDQKRAYADIVSYVRKSKIKISDQFKQELDSKTWNEMRNKIGRNVLTYNSGADITEFLNEMNKVLNTTIEVTGRLTDDLRTLYDVLLDVPETDKIVERGLGSYGFNLKYIEDTVRANTQRIPQIPDKSNEDIVVSNNDITTSNEEVSASEKKKQEILENPIPPQIPDNTIKSNDAIIESNDKVIESEKEKREAISEPTPPAPPTPPITPTSSAPPTPPRSTPTTPPIPQIPPTPVNPPQPPKAPQVSAKQKQKKGSDIIRQRGYTSEDVYSETEKLGIAGRQTTRYVLNDDGDYEPFILPVELDYNALLNELEKLDKKLLELTDKQAKALNAGIATPKLDEYIDFVRGQIREAERELSRYGTDSDYSLDMREFIRKRAESNTLNWHVLDTKNEQIDIREQKKLSDKVSKDNERLDAFLRTLDKNYQSISSNIKLPLNSNQLTLMDDNRNATANLIEQIRKDSIGSNKTLDRTDIDIIQRAITDSIQLGKNIQEDIRNQQQLSKEVSKDNARLDAFIRTVDKNYQSVVSNKKLALDANEQSRMKSNRDATTSLIEQVRADSTAKNTPLDATDIDIIQRAISDSVQLGKNIQESVRQRQALSDKLSKDNEKLDAYIRTLDRNYHSVIDNKTLTIDSNQYYRMSTNRSKVIGIIEEIRKDLNDNNRTLNASDIDTIQREISDSIQLGKNIQESIRLARERSKAKSNVERTLNNFLVEIANADDQYLHDITKPIKQSDLDDMKKRRQDVEDYINGFRGAQSLSPTDIYNLQLVRNDYKRQAKDTQRSNYLATKLTPDSLLVDIESLRTKVKTLLNDMKESGAVTGQFEKDLIDNVLNKLSQNIDVTQFQKLRDEYKKINEQFKAADNDFQVNKKPQSDESYNKEIAAIKEIYRLKEANARLDEQGDKDKDRKQAENDAQIQSLRQQIKDEQNYRKKFGLETEQGEAKAIKAEADALEQYNQNRRDYNDLLTAKLPFMQEEAYAEDYQLQLDIIKQLIVEQDKLNNLRTKQIKRKDGEDYSSFITEQEQVVKDALKKAQAANDSINRARGAYIAGNVQFGPTQEQADEADKLFKQGSSGGSDESKNKLENAENVKKLSEQKEALQNLKKAANEYAKAMSNLMNAAYAGSESNKMNNLYNSMVKARAELDKYEQAAATLKVPTDEIDKIKKSIDESFTSDQVNIVDKLYSKLESFVLNLGTVTGRTTQDITDLRNELTLLLASLKTSDGDLDATILADLRDFGEDLQNRLKEIKETNNEELDIEKRFKDFQNQINDSGTYANTANKISDYTSTLAKYQTALNDIFTSYYQVDQNGNLILPDKAAMDSTLEQLKQLSERFNNFIKMSDSYSATNKDGVLHSGSIGDIHSTEDLKKAMDAYITSQNYGHVENLKVAASGDKVTATFEEQDGVVRKLTATWDQHIEGMRLQEETTQKHRSGLRGIIDELGQYVTMNLDVGDVIRTVSSEFRKSIEVFKEYDASLTNISYTMDLTREGLHNIGKDALDMADELSLSVQDAMGIYEIYANMNTTAEEIMATAGPTAILSNISGVDTETTSDQIQGVLQQFSMLDESADNIAEASMHVVDVLSYLSANVSIDNVKAIGIMSDAIQASGAEAYQAGLSFEQLAAISAKISERTRDDGSSIGNALKTIIVRLSKVGSMPGYESEVSNDEISKAAESLNVIGVRVYEASGEFRQLDTILGELNAKWDTLTDAQKANISYNVAA